MNSNKKKDSNIFSMLFSRESEELTQINEENILKLIKKNDPLNKIRSQSHLLSQELEKVKDTKIFYKREDQQQLFNEIHDEFQKSCKEIYRKFKIFIEGAEEDDLRKSVFAGMKSSNSSISL